jgi:hypothetical protein
VTAKTAADTAKDETSRLMEFIRTNFIGPVFLRLWREYGKKLLVVNLILRGAVTRGAAHFLSGQRKRGVVEEEV